jgi:hypothetical protein
MIDHQQFLEKKSALLSVIIIGIVGILALPVILPHAYHGFHIVHILLHVGGIILAVFLTILAIMAYNRLKTKRLALTSVAFSIFIVAEVITLIDATWPTSYNPGNISLLEIGHILLLLTLGLLAMGALRND